MVVEQVCALNVVEHFGVGIVPVMRVDSLLEVRRRGVGREVGLVTLFGKVVVVVALVLGGVGDFSKRKVKFLRESGMAVGDDLVGGGGDVGAILCKELS